MNPFKKTTLTGSLDHLILIVVTALVASVNIVAQVPRKTSSRPVTQKPQPAQTPPQSQALPPVETFTVDRTLATIPVIATEGGGSYVSDLRADEFSVYEDDIKQNIDFFKAI